MSVLSVPTPIRNKSQLIKQCNDILRAKLKDVVQRPQLPRCLRCGSYHLLQQTLAEGPHFGQYHEIGCDGGEGYPPQPSYTHLLQDPEYRPVLHDRNLASNPGRLRDMQSSLILFTPSPPSTPRKRPVSPVSSPLSAKRARRNAKAPQALPQTSTFSMLSTPPKREAISQSSTIDLTQDTVAVYFFQQPNTPPMELKAYPRDGKVAVMDILPWLPEGTELRRVFAYAGTTFRKNTDSLIAVRNTCPVLLKTLSVTTEDVLSWFEEFEAKRLAML